MTPCSKIEISIKKGKQVLKSFVEDSINTYSLYSSAADVLSHLFTTLGNGISLDHRGYIRSSSTILVDGEFDYTPTQLRSVYPWNDNIA